MTGNQIRESYINFFTKQGHALVHSAPLVPENDPTTLFTGSGMQPLLPYFLGEVHPLGTRIVDSQKCFRAEDIEEIGDNRHTTFFEMLGNWSFGDYFKDEQLKWLYTWLTQDLKLNADNLVVTVFEGNTAAARDDEAIGIWQELFQNSKDAMPGLAGFQRDTKIYLYGEKKNWWSRSGTPEQMPAGEPGGTTSEVFYRFDHVEHDPSFGPVCHPNCDCGKFIEIGNSVFMEFVKKDDGSFAKLPSRNIDFGGGLERLTAAAYNTPDVFETDLFSPLIDKVVAKTGKEYVIEHKPAMRIIADHLRGSVMMMAEEIVPSNKEQGYIVRRLLRRAMVQADSLGVQENFMAEMVPILASYFEGVYPEVMNKVNAIQDWVDQEEHRFRKVISQGKKVLFQQIEKEKELTVDVIAQILFDLYQSHGLPLEISEELVKKRILELSIDTSQLEEKFKQLKEAHADTSRTSVKGTFKGGLQDSSATILKYHTCTHLLHQALSDVLGDQVQQMGSNITSERLRFDFKYDQKMTVEQLQKVEEIINQKIDDDLPVIKTVESKDAAIASGAKAFFKETYPEKVSVYTIGKNSDKDWYSKELCGGPHVSHTGEIGQVKIVKEQAVGAGIRRVYVELI